jgi:DNA-binding response OmpR family regulator
VPASDSAPTVLVTVQISITEADLSPAADGLVVHLRGLIEQAAAAARAEPVADRTPSRPRLVVAGEGATASQVLVHQASRTVYRDRQPVHLTRREYDLFVFLARNPRRVYTRGQLLRQVWGYEPAAGERTVDVHVRRLRTKLGGRPPVVATVRGVGYRLGEAVPVALQADPDEPGEPSTSD